MNAWKRTKVILVTVLVVLVLIVGFQNNSSVELHALFWTFNINRLALFLILFVLGAAAGALAAWVGGRRRKADGVEAVPRNPGN